MIEDKRFQKSRDEPQPESRRVPMEEEPTIEEMEQTLMKIELLAELEEELLRRVRRPFWL